MLNPTQRPLTDNTQPLQETDIHATGGIRTCSPSKRAAADPRSRPRRYWDRRHTYREANSGSAVQEIQYLPWNTEVCQTAAGPRLGGRLIRFTTLNRISLTCILIFSVISTKFSKGLHPFIFFKWNFVYTGLLKVIVGVLTTCHTSFSRCNPMWFLSIGLRQGSGLCSSSSRKYPGS